MAAIFEALPGLEVPVSEISRRLVDLWTTPDATGGSAAPAAEDARATQVNLVLHFGFGTRPEDALAQFQTTVRFSRRCPSRVVVLCPLVVDRGETEMRAKIFGECYLGRTRSDARCVEFVLLSYPRAARPYLENQVSICLSTDLPLYYWPHRFSDCSKLADYRFLLGAAKRVLIDGGLAPEDMFTYPWPNPSALRDLVHARLLPVRQTIGQFLAAYSPAVLVDGLTSITVSHGSKYSAEGKALLAWMQRRLAACGASEQVKGKVSAGEVGTLAVSMVYSGTKKYFRWNGDLASGHADFESALGGGIVRLRAPVRLLTPERSLSEAMFL